MYQAKIFEVLIFMHQINKSIASQIFLNHMLSIQSKSLGRYSKCDFKYLLKRTKQTIYSGSSLVLNYEISSGLI